MSRITRFRNRGTVGGSLAHADPAAELPGVAVTCEGEITLFGPAGSRTIRAGDFFIGPLSTLRQSDEIVTELHLPKWLSGRRRAFRNMPGVKAISPSPPSSCFITRTGMGR